MNSDSIVEHRSAEQLEAGLATILASPQDRGIVEMLVRRPRVNERELLEVAELEEHAGLVGDRWLHGNGQYPLETHLTLMNSRVIELLAGVKERWPLAGDQIYLDLDLSQKNLPPGTRLTVGSAQLEIAAEPHTGCKKFVSRFGAAAMKFVNSEQGRSLNLRGIYAKVLAKGSVRVGDSAIVLSRPTS